MPAEPLDELGVRLQAALNAERYTIERELGSGGMSRIFLATERSLDRQVVVKVLPPELTATVSVERFRREMVLAAQLQHPHIVPVLSAGEADGLLYYTMPYVSGESLRRRLGTPMPIAETTKLLADVSRALAYAHKRGVVHRDIKPENILSADDSFLIIDFGVAKALSDAGAVAGSGLTSAGIALGTPVYMAPEQASADPTLDHRADLYALGAVIYEALIGEPPFVAPTTQQLIMAHMTRAPESLTKRRPEVPRALCDLVMCLLAKDPKDRPQSAEEVLSALGSGEAPAYARKARRRSVAVIACAGLVAAGAIGFLAWRGGRSASLASEPRSVAVLPFENLSADRDNEYFSDGMTEELIDALSHIEGLQVAARTSSFAFKGKNIDVREIGRQLSVGAVLEGSVRREGKRLRVTAQLVNVANGYHIWSRMYEREVSDAFAVQDEIARTIADTLRLKLGGASAATARRPTESAEAYELYLKGRYFSNTRRNTNELRTAIGFFRQALALDPGYARAYSGLADSYSLLAVFGEIRPDSVFPPAKVAALQAIKLDSTLAEAHTSLGFVYLVGDWDFPKAKLEIEHAIALNPAYPPAHLFNAWLLTVAGRVDAGVEELKLAQRLDPLNLLINTRLGTILIYARRYAEARAQLERTLQLDSTYQLARHQLVILDAAEGHAPRPGGAPHAPEVLPNADAEFVGLSDVVRATRANALAVARELEVRARDHHVPLDAIAGIFTTIGERDSAMTWLERARQAHQTTLIFAGVEPTFDPLHSDPRFLQLLERIGVRNSLVARRD